MTRRLALIALLTVAAGSAPAQQYTFAVNQVTAAAGSTGNVTLEVTLTYSGPSDSARVGGFQFRITAPSAAGVSYTAADEATATAGYIFGGNGFGLFPSGTNTPTDFTASDLWLTPNDGVALTSGQTVGLGRITFDLSAGAAVGTPIPISLSPGDTTLSDAAGVPITTGLTFLAGSVTPVPEPGLVGLCAAGGLLVVRRFRQVGGCKTFSASIALSDRATASPPHTSHRAGQRIEGCHPLRSSLTS